MRGRHQEGGRVSSVNQTDVDRALASLGAGPLPYVSFGIGQVRWPDRRRDAPLPAPPPRAAEPEPEAPAPAPVMAVAPAPAGIEPEAPDLPALAEAEADLEDYQPVLVVAEAPPPVPFALGADEPPLADPAEFLAAPEPAPLALGSHHRFEPARPPRIRPEPEPEPRYVAPAALPTLGSPRPGVPHGRPTVADMFRRLSNDAGPVAARPRKTLSPPPSPDPVPEPGWLPRPELRQLLRTPAASPPDLPEPPAKREERSEVAVSGVLPRLSELLRHR
jgi:hypothetical protein